MAPKWKVIKYRVLKSIRLNNGVFGTTVTVSYHFFQCLQYLLQTSFFSAQSRRQATDTLCPAASCCVRCAHLMRGNLKLQLQQKQNPYFSPNLSIYLISVIFSLCCVGCEGF